MFSNFIISECKLILLPLLLTFIYLVVLPLSFNISSKSLVILLLPLISYSVLSSSSLLLLTILFFSPSKVYNLLQCQFVFSTYYLMINMQIFLIVAAFSNNPFSGKHLHLSKICIYQYFLMIKHKHWQLVYLNCIWIYFAQFCFDFFSDSNFKISSS